MIAEVDTFECEVLKADKINRRTVIFKKDGVELDRHQFDVNDGDKRKAFAEAVREKLYPSRLPTAREQPHWNARDGIPYEHTEEARIAELILAKFKAVEAAEKQEAEEASRISPSQKAVNTLIDHAMPYSDEAERGVLGSTILQPDVLDDIALTTRAEDFYNPAHRKLFAHMMAMRSEGTPLDTTLLVDRLRDAGDLEFVGGTSFIAELALEVPTVSNAVYYSKIVTAKSKARAFIQASMSLLRDAYAGASPEELLSRVDAQLQSLDGPRADGVIMLGPATSARLDELNRRLRGEPTKGVTTGLHDVDGFIGRMGPGEMIVVGARPSMGKTAFGAGVAMSAAEQSDDAVLFFSMEMSRGELVDRILSGRSGVNGKRIRDARLSDDERRDIVDAQCSLDQVKLAIDDCPRRTVADIAAQTRRVQRQTPLSLVVIDYIGLIEAENGRDPRQEQVAKIARRLKLMAKELAVPVLVLAQLNREVEKGNEHRPKLSHLRESGAIEQDADVVLLLHRPEAYQADADNRGKAEIFVAKNRRGPTGMATVIWKAETAQFLNAARGEEWKY